MHIQETTRNARREADKMKTLAIVTILFLPATFLSVCPFATLSVTLFTHIHFSIITSDIKEPLSADTILHGTLRVAFRPPTTITTRRRLATERRGPKPGEHDINQPTPCTRQQCCIRLVLEAVHPARSRDDPCRAWAVPILVAIEPRAAKTVGFNNCWKVRHRCSNKEGTGQSGTVFKGLLGPANLFHRTSSSSYNQFSSSSHSCITHGRYLFLPSTSRQLLC